MANAQRLIYHNADYWGWFEMAWMECFVTRINSQHHPVPWNPLNKWLFISEWVVFIVTFWKDYCIHFSCGQIYFDAVLINKDGYGIYLLRYGAKLFLVWIASLEHYGMSWMCQMTCCIGFHMTRNGFGGESGILALKPKARFLKP